MLKLEKRHVRTTEPKLELHNSLHNIAQSILHVYTFLGAFAELRKATSSFVMSVCPSVCPHGTTRLPLDLIFIKI